MVYILIITLLWINGLYAQDWFNGCINKQVICDATNYKPLFYSEDIITTTNCIFRNCPGIQIRKSIVNISSTQFINSFSSDAPGGALGIYAESIVDIVNSKFINCSTYSNGGAIYVEWSTLNLQNVLLKNNSYISPGITGSAIGSIYSTLNMINVDVEDNIGISKMSSPAQNSAINLRLSKGYWRGGSCRNNFPTCLAGGGTRFQIKTINIAIPSHSNYGIGGGLYIEEGVDLLMEDVDLVSYSSGTNCIYGWMAQLIIKSTRLRNCVNMDGKDTRAGALELQGSGSSAQLINSEVINSIGSKGGAIYVSLAQLVINNTLIQNCSAINSGGGGLYAEYESSVDIDAGTVFKNNHVKKYSGGSIVISMDSQLVLGKCEISYSSAHLCGGGLAFFSDNSTLGYGFRIKPGTRPLIKSNVAHLDGGGIYIESSGEANITGIEMYNNTAKRCGGAMASAMNVKWSLGPMLHLYANNSAIMGSSLCILQNGGNVSLGDEHLLEKNPIIIDGTVWVSNLTFASLVMDLKSKWKGDHRLQGPPYSIRLVGDETQVRRQLKGPINPKSQIPAFDVVSLDYFGNHILVDPRRPVIIQLEEINNNATIVGEGIQAIIEYPPRVTFSNLSIAGGPGNYKIKTKVLGFYDYALDASFDILVEECEPGKKFSDQSQQCLALESIHPLARYATSAVGAICILCAILLIRLLVKCRQEKIVKGNSLLFLALSTVGTIISLAAVVSRIQAYSLECILSFWMENVGFFFIYGALLLKTFRIQRLFRADMNQAKLTSLRKAYTEKQLLIVFCIFQLIVIIYLVVATLLDPPTILPAVVIENKMVIDRCSTSQFMTIISIVRLVLEMLTGFLVYQIRNVPSNFNESRSIGFVAYNWILFGGALSVICDYVITNVTVAFALKQISIILPNIFLLVFLIASKLVPYMQQAFYGSQLGLTGKAINAAAARGFTADYAYVQRTNPTSNKKTELATRARDRMTAKNPSEYS